MKTVSKETIGNEDSTTNLMDILNLEESPFIKLSKRLSQELESIAEQKFNVRYMFAGPVPETESGLDSVKNPEIELKDVELSDRETIVNFIETNYFSKYPKFYSKSDIQLSRDGFEDYFKMGAVGKIFMKGVRVVGLILLNRSLSHPVLEVPAIHVGFAGYDRDHVNKAEARFIKSQWNFFINQISQPGDTLEGSVRTFNIPSLGIVEKNGLDIVAVKFDKRL